MSCMFKVFGSLSPYCSHVIVASQGGVICNRPATLEASSVLWDCDAHDFLRNLRRLALTGSGSVHIAKCDGVSNRSYLNHRSRAVFEP